VEIIGNSKFLAITGQRWRPELAGELRDGEVLRSELQQLLATSTSSRNGPALLHGGSFSAEADDEILNKMFASKHGTRIRALWNGDTSAHGNDWSAADLALTGYLAFWFGPAADRIDRMFRRSGLMRAKWGEKHCGDGKTYGQMTIAKALDGRIEFYSLRGTNGAHFGGNGFSANGQPVSGEAPAADAKLTDVGNSLRFAAEHRDG